MRHVHAATFPFQIANVMRRRDPKRDLGGAFLIVRGTWRALKIESG
jgi:hypothetical protein